MKDLQTQLEISKYFEHSAFIWIPEGKPSNEMDVKKHGKFFKLEDLRLFDSDNLL